MKYRLEFFVYIIEACLYDISISPKNSNYLGQATPYIQLQISVLNHRILMHFLPNINFQVSVLKT